MKHTKIEWTDRTWNPLRGCSRVSEGCRNCYAEKVAARFSAPGLPYDGLAKDGKWTGSIMFLPEKLHEPLGWREPQRVFVNSMSDLFHEKVPDDFIHRVFAVMAFCPEHIFQILTKRPERMRNFMQGFRGINLSAIDALTNAPKWRKVPTGLDLSKPLPNVWLGVSVEDQQTADERIPLLLQTRAAVRFISAEPLLGPVDLSLGLRGWDVRPCMPDGEPEQFQTPILDWVIVGGESGPGARIFDIGWARALLAQCKSAGVPFFMKQLGGCPIWTNQEATSEYDQPWGPVELKDRKGGNPEEWPEDLCVREFPYDEHQTGD